MLTVTRGPATHHTGGTVAKYEATLRGPFDAVLEAIEGGVSRSSTATLEDASDFTTGGVRCAVRVYERYSVTGSNRVSLSVTLVGGADGALFLSGITSGGSQAVFFKINTLGEGSFLDRAVEIIERYKSGG